MARLSVTRLAKSFGPKPVLSGVDLDVAEGALVAVLGASGSGKTTLLRLICGFERADSGVVAIDGETVSITNQPRFNAKLRRANHNQLRMTRVLIFLKCMGWTELMDGLRGLLVANVPHGMRAVRFWNKV